MPDEISTSAYELDTEVKRLKKNINSGFLELAKHLKQIRDEQLYKDLDYGTFESYIAQPELAFSRRSVYRFIQIYEKFVLELKVDPKELSSTDYSKLEKVLPYVDETNKDEWLSKAEALSLSDLNEETRGNVPTPSHTKPEEMSVDTSLQRIVDDAEKSGHKQNSKDYEGVSYLEVQKILKRLITFDPASQFLMVHITKHGSSWNISVSGDKPIPTKQIRRPNCPLEVKNPKFESLQKQYPNGHKECVEFIDSASDNKFPNYAKQIGHLHNMLRAGYTFDDIEEVILEMGKNPFWKQKGWDMASVSNEIGRIKDGD